MLEALHNLKNSETIEIHRCTNSKSSNYIEKCNFFGKMGPYDRQCGHLRQDVDAYTRCVGSAFENTLNEGVEATARLMGSAINISKRWYTVSKMGEKAETCKNHLLTTWKMKFNAENEA